MDEARTNGEAPESGIGPASPRVPAGDLKVVDRRWWARPEGTDSTEGGATAEESESALRKPTYLEELERKLAEKDELLQTYMSRYTEAVKEFEDAKARIRRDVSKDVERGRRVFLVEMLEILDNLERAIEAARRRDIDTLGTEALAFIQGIELVQRQFLARLEGFGVRRLDSLGEPFDPTRHEAVSIVPERAPERDGIVVGVIKPGYAIGDEILRPAMVSVTKYEATPA